MASSRHVCLSNATPACVCPDEDTWNVAHRILGIISLPLALLYVAASLTLDDFETVSIAAMALWVGLPGVLSYIYYWKKYHGRL